MDGLTTRGLNLWYGKFQALMDVNLTIPHGKITSMIGPSGCGKTTLLRCFNHNAGGDPDPREEHLRF